MDLGLSNSPSSIFETSTIGMDHNFRISFPSSSVSHVETLVLDILQDNIVKMHEDLIDLKNHLIGEETSNLSISLIDNIHHRLEDKDGIEVSCNLAQIFEKIHLTLSGTLHLNKIQG